MLAVSAFGQDVDYPEIEVAAGYANLTFPFEVSALGPHVLSGPAFPDRHYSGGFVNFNWNRRPWFALENYLGVYKLGDVILITDIPGTRLAARNIFAGRVTPFVLGGFGVGVFTERVSTFTIAKSTYTHWSPAARYGAGMDVQLNEGLAMRVEAGRMTFRVTRWLTDWNISPGLVFRF